MTRVYIVNAPCAQTVTSVTAITKSKGTPSGRGAIRTGSWKAYVPEEGVGYPPKAVIEVTEVM